jgi:hypothetical protein
MEGAVVTAASLLLVLTEIFLGGAAPAESISTAWHLL